MQQSDEKQFNWDNAWEEEITQDTNPNENIDTPQNENNWDTFEDNTSENENNWDTFEDNTPEDTSNQNNNWENNYETDTPKIDPITNQSEDAHLPFVSEVEDFNKLFNKPNNYTPTVGSKKDWMFIYDFIKEELEEYKEACEQKDIIGILDALCDIAYVSLGNGTMLHGLKTKIWPAYSEVQRSNLSKACKTAQEAIDTLKQRTKEQEEPCHVEQFGDMYIVYRTRDRKVMKNIYFTEPDLYQFFSQEELNKSTTPVKFNVNDLKEVNIDTLSEKAENEDNTFTDTNEEDTW